MSDTTRGRTIPPGIVSFDSLMKNTITPITSGPAPGTEAGRTDANSTSGPTDGVPGLRATTGSLPGFSTSTVNAHFVSPPPGFEAASTTSTLPVSRGVQLIFPVSASTLNPEGPETTFHEIGGAPTASAVTGQLTPTPALPGEVSTMPRG